jgi:hypothetical protein
LISRRRCVELPKVIHGWGSSGAGGRLGPAIRKSLRLEDSAALRTVGGASGSCPALGEDLGYGLKLRARGPGGTVAPRLRRGIRSAVNCTLDGPARQPFPAAVAP